MSMEVYIITRQDFHNGEPTMEDNPVVATFRCHNTALEWLVNFSKIMHQEESISYKPISTDILESLTINYNTLLGITTTYTIIKDELI